jgi:hypothetical protein
MPGFADLILRSSFTILSWLFSPAFNILIELPPKNFRKIIAGFMKNTVLLATPATGRNPSP